MVLPVSSYEITSYAHMDNYLGPCICKILSFILHFAVLIYSITCYSAVCRLVAVDTYGRFIVLPNYDLWGRVVHTMIPQSHYPDTEWDIMSGLVFQWGSNIKSPWVRTVISEYSSGYDRAHSLRLYSAASLGHQSASTLTMTLDVART